MKINLLADHKKVLPILTDWYLSEWEPYYGVDGPGDAKADLESRCNYKEIPLGLVAIEGDQVLGTVALDLDAATNLTPSVVGLLVGRAYRRRGIAAALLKSAEDLARTLGYSRVYMSTTVLDNLLERMGWKKLEEVEFLNTEPGWIYVRDF
jgi:GNAT superfamily N-acetyltransferase